MRIGRGKKMVKKRKEGMPGPNQRGRWTTAPWLHLAGIFSRKRKRAGDEDACRSQLREKTEKGKKKRFLISVRSRVE